MSLQSDILTDTLIEKFHATTNIINQAHQLVMHI